MKKYINRLLRMDALIRRKATGTPEEFAEKMNMSRSNLMRNLSDLKNLDAPIAYDSARQSYYYTDDVKLVIGFKKPLDTLSQSPFLGVFFEKNPSLKI